MANQVIITGNLTHDPELKKTQSGKSVVNLGVAVRRPRTKEDVTDFFDVTCWGATAEFVCKWFKKGSPVLVNGRLQNQRWEDESGKKRVRVEIVAENIEFFSVKKVVEATATQTNEESAENADLPF